MEKRTKVTAAGVIAVLILIAVVVAGILVKKYTPSKEIMKLTDYYEAADDEALIIFKDGVYDKKAFYNGKAVYVDYQTVLDKFNKRFYWDSNENLLIYATPTEVVKTGTDSREYYVNKSKNSVDYPIVKLEGENIYIALDFVKLYSNIEYQFFEEPNRVVLDYQWGTDYMYSTAEEDTQLRYEPDIKSDILKELKENDLLVYMDTQEKKDEKFSKVMTEDGVIGYVKDKALNKAYHEKLENDYTEEKYSHITKDYKINMVWHQVLDESQNDELLNQLNNTKGVTTVSPTWYRLASEEGDVDSLASEEYVDRAHKEGVEVWALVTDIVEGDKEVDVYQILSRTSRREKLINELVSNAIKIDLDGLNIDFEKISQKTAPHFLEFLRELSVKCRNNGIVLSVDNYVPSEYTSHYDREEEGEIADYLITMAYDEHYAGSEEAGSVSSISFVQKAVDDILTLVPKERVIIAIPFYTRIWHETEVGGDKDLTSEAYAMENAISILEQNGVEYSWDEETGQYYAEYSNEDGTVLNKVWLEEDDSIEAKMKVISEADVAGISAWKLGLEKESVWDIILKYNN